MGLLSKRDTLSVCLLGLQGAGKSTIYYRWCTGKYVDTLPTLSSSCEKIRLGERRVTLVDVPGAAMFARSGAWNQYAEVSDVVVFVVDGSDLSSFNTVQKELGEIDAWLADKGSGDSERIPVVVLANKADKPGALKQEEILDRVVPKVVRDRRTVVAFATDAKSGDGLHIALDWIVVNVFALKKSVSKGQLGSLTNGTGSTRNLSDVTSDLDSSSVVDSTDDLASPASDTMKKKKSFESLRNMLKALGESSSSPVSISVCPPGLTQEQQVEWMRNQYSQALSNNKEFDPRGWGKAEKKNYIMTEAEKAAWEKVKAMGLLSPTKTAAVTQNMDPQEKKEWMENQKAAMKYEFDPRGFAFNG